LFDVRHNDITRGTIFRSANEDAYWLLILHRLVPVLSEGDFSRPNALERGNGHGETVRG
jgi:hypothetical protein